MKRRILLVDDELAILLTLKAILEINGFEVDTAASAKEAVAKLNGSTYHMVITDMRMEHDKAGYDVLREAKKTSYNPAVSILTAFPVLGGEWKNYGADSLLVKPMNTNDLLRQIEVLLIQHEDEKQREKLESPRSRLSENGRRQPVPETKRTAKITQGKSGTTRIAPAKS